MLNEICMELRNYFLRDYGDIHSGVFTIENGSIESLPFLQNGQYFRIVGSIFNDGVHKFGDAEDVLVDEVFNGAIWAMAVPQDVINLAAEIEDWNEKNADILSSPYSSESFGGYSYSKTSVYGGGESQVLSWKTNFASRLAPYKRLTIL